MSLPPECVPPELGETMKPYREIAALSILQIVCFFLLSHLEPDFFLLHFYQTIVYLAILIMLFYMEDRWAYMIGIIAPAVWLIMSLASGLLGGAARQVLQLGHGRALTNPISFLAGVTAILSLLMIAACARRWMKEYSGLGKSLSTALISGRDCGPVLWNSGGVVLAHDPVCGREKLNKADMVVGSSPDVGRDFLHKWP